MGILNATPDSFYAASRALGADAFRQRLRQMRSEGTDIIDIGACSTRPGSTPVSEDEEWARLLPLLPLVREEWPDAIVSLDTFRPSIAERAMDLCGIDIVNDVSGGREDMYRLVAETGTAYVLTFSQALGETDDAVAAALLFLEERLQHLHRLGQMDVLVDPGFGFGKTHEQNWDLLRRLSALQLLEQPVLVGISRKRMVREAAGLSADEALDATNEAHALAIRAGAKVVRTHDVASCKALIAQVLGA